MSLYLSSQILHELNECRKDIFKIRHDIYRKYKIDLLDTDALSALSVYEIVSRYDSDFNINFSRNGEDARSGDVHVEMKAARVGNQYTKRGRLRKNAHRDAIFLFHAMGDIEHKRYMFVARDKDDLSIKRIYDIANAKNCKKIYEKLLNERSIWLEKSKFDQSKMKHDVIVVNESFLLECFSNHMPLIIGDIKIFKDW